MGLHVNLGFLSRGSRRQKIFLESIPGPRLVRFLETTLLGDACLDSLSSAFRDDICGFQLAFNPNKPASCGCCDLGILPDYMHIVHLACTGDALVALLLDLSDTEYPWPGGSRDARLSFAWDSYKGYCQRWNVPDRCERKVFSNELLKGDYPTLSQKFMRAAAAKYVVFWMQWLMRTLVDADPSPADHLLYFGCCIKSFTCE